MLNFLRCVDGKIEMEVDLGDLPTDPFGGFFGDMDAFDYRL